MKHSGSGLRISWLGVLVGLCVLGTTQPAAASVGDGMLLSADGSNWASTLERPIFSGSFVHVPGSSNTGSVWIKNSSDGQALLAAAAVTAYGPRELTRHLGLQVRSWKRTTEAAALADSGGCVDLLTGWPMQSGESLRLDFTLHMHATAPNGTMHETAQVDVRFLMQGDDRNASHALASGSACSRPEGTVVPGTVMRDPEPVAPSATRGAPVFPAARPEDINGGVHATPLASTGITGLGVWVGTGTLVVVLGVVLVVLGQRRKAGAH
ncbi:hypothetical protein J2809_000330 [Arthrobacter pascens]|uniref:hypothetical protein n=1 Tax=Arthrobacter pascens TaxID=1677 RepID=UPI00285F44DF|nr:hypothetical protein [Arthrobacter pascens]MDR6555999.1 hypothetical protein [Arthrobacter pascens]